MWSNIRKLGAAYASGVLTALDVQGYPSSIRVQPVYRDADQTISLTLPASADLQPGPASLLFHFHDEALWGLTSHLIRGVLKQSDETWIFQPTGLIPGSSQSGPDTFRFLLQSRRTASQYLQRHHLPRPRVDWDAIKALRKRAR
jgi:hypothetical protein